MTDLKPPSVSRNPVAPEPDGIRPVAPGILHLRLPLPFRLNHVNVYLVEDGDGWFLVDTGPGDEAGMAVWTSLLEAGPDGPLRGRPITRILVTHHHPDHVGAAAMLAERTGAPLLMGDIEYLTTLTLVAGDPARNGAARDAFYRRNGVDRSRLTGLQSGLGRYRDLVPALPDTYRAIRAGDILRVGERRLTVFDMPGHAPAQIVLHSTTDNILFAADQVMERITPNIGASDRTTDDDPLGRYLDSLAVLRTHVPDGGLVLPGHHQPFRHLHRRIAEITAHHAERSAAIEAFCAAGKGLTAAELVPLLFPFDLDPHQFWFALSEIVAHLNDAGRRGRLEARDSHGRRRWGTVGRASHTA